MRILCVISAAFIGCSDINLSLPPEEPPDRDVELIQRRQMWKEHVDYNALNHTIRRSWMVPHEDLELLIQDRDAWRAWATAWKDRFYPAADITAKVSVSDSLKPRPD